MTNELEMMKAMASLFKKKAAVMNALEGGMSKKGTNTHFNYKFVTASDIKQTVGRLFAEHGLSLQMSGVGTQDAISRVEKKDGSYKEVPILRVQFSISVCDVDTGAVEQSFWFGEAGATDDKAASKAATSALKYFLISNLLIADKDEDKHDTDRDRRKTRPEQAAPQTHAPASSNGSSSANEPNWWLALKVYLKQEYGNSIELIESQLNAARRVLKDGRVDVSSTLEDVLKAMKSEIPF
jgi:hypothetical protein